MDRLEAMITIERYGESLRCSVCDHKVPSIGCESGKDCPLLAEYEKMEPHDDVEALANKIRSES
jgi:hypothetical protein